MIFSYFDSTKILAVLTSTCTYNLCFRAIKRQNNVYSGNPRFMQIACCTVGPAAQHSLAAFFD